VTVFLRRSPASLRHLVWALACGGRARVAARVRAPANWGLAGWPRLEVPVAFNAEQITRPRRHPTHTCGARRPEGASASSEFGARATVGEEPVRWRLTTDWTALVFPICSAASEPS